MRDIRRSIVLVMLVCSILLLETAMVSASLDGGGEPVVVGRISYVEGNVLRYLEQDEDWAAVDEDEPFGPIDALYSGEASRAEFMFPNTTWVRISENTQIQLLSLTPEVSSIDVVSGLARLYNKSDEAMVKATTPYGTVVISPGAVVDLYVGDQSVEVVCVDGVVDFLHAATSARYSIAAGSSSLLADKEEVGNGDGTVDTDWDDWNGERDNGWRRRLRQGQESAQYLPNELADQSYVLAESGEWQSVNYNGEYQKMWRPIRVPSGWLPFRFGYWIPYYGDNCWIPKEPFGYITHHFGSWVYIEEFQSWFWMPPGHRRSGRHHGNTFSFGWYPGRVGWLSSGDTIGWVPLAPEEPYYGHRKWGRRTEVVTDGPAVARQIDLNRYRYLSLVTAVPARDIYRKDLGKREKRTVDKETVISEFKPVVQVLPDGITSFKSVALQAKPHGMVVARIKKSQGIGMEIPLDHKEGIEREVMKYKPQMANDHLQRLPRPSVSTKMVTPENVHKPLESLPLERKEIKPQGHERTIMGEQISEKNRNSFNGNRFNDLREKTIQAPQRTNIEQNEANDTSPSDAPTLRPRSSVRKDGGMGQVIQEEQPVIHEQRVEQARRQRLDREMIRQKELNQIEARREEEKIKEEERQRREQEDVRLQNSLKDRRRMPEEMREKQSREVLPKSELPIPRSKEPAELQLKQGTKSPGEEGPPSVHQEGKRQFQEKKKNKDERDKQPEKISP